MRVVPSCANEQRRATVFLNEELKIKNERIKPPSMQSNIIRAKRCNFALRF